MEGSSGERIGEARWRTESIRGGLLTFRSKWPAKSRSEKGRLKAFLAHNNGEAQFSAIYLLPNKGT